MRTLRLAHILPGSLRRYGRRRFLHTNYWYSGKYNVNMCVLPIFFHSRTSTNLSKSIHAVFCSFHASPSVRCRSSAGMTVSPADSEPRGRTRSFVFQMPAGHLVASEPCYSIVHSRRRAPRPFAFTLSFLNLRNLRPNPSIDYPCSSNTSATLPTPPSFTPRRGAARPYRRHLACRSHRACSCIRWRRVLMQNADPSRSLSSPFYFLPYLFFHV
ncbi:hypothetical protein C8F04DRAFT_1088195 [Mycena alexandri]|uniref:Uncharacterized protein n=1 Tax=Mycena alexandri TaxID=1745969 RepID=A0AAD6T7Y8_9AGAR|nr:hypothetical protein C8F04DRAFT_1088195 [Mycena alexandri]